MYKNAHIITMMAHHPCCLCRRTITSSLLHCRSIITNAHNYTHFPITSAISHYHNIIIA